MTDPSQPLTILEEFLLLSLDEAQGQFYPLARSAFDCATAGAVLMDLALRQRIDNDLRDVFVIDSTPTGSAILDSSLQTMALQPVLTPKPLGHWLRQFSEEGEALREQALRHLETSGILGLEDRKILWMFGGRRYAVLQPQAQKEVKLRILGVILRDTIPEAHDIVLVALAQACDLFRHILSDHELASAAPRIEQVARMDLIGQAVVKAVAEVETVIAMTSGFR